MGSHNVMFISCNFLCKRVGIKNICSTVKRFKKDDIIDSHTLIKIHSYYFNKISMIRPFMPSIIILSVPL